ncbi:MAG TPA: Ig-like domain-containing protein [Thermomicrobiales bacterium]|nr:Ig-like domain-containing protein [Thermomicrobiales bacterium]
MDPTARRALAWLRMLLFFLGVGGLLLSPRAIVAAGSPSANNDAYADDFNTTMEIFVPGVLANDYDPDGSPLHTSPVQDATYGTLTLYPDGSFTYTPAPGFFGQDSFTYVAITNDSRISNIATVTIYVSSPPPTDIPTLVPTDTPTLVPTATPSDTPTSIPTETLVPTDTATAVPTSTATNTPVPTDTATTIPTDTPTVVPTNTSTAVPTTTVAPTSTTVSATLSPSMTNVAATDVPTGTNVPPTEVPTGTAGTTGSVALTLTTDDGGPVPDGAIVCVGNQCQTVGAEVSSAAVSATTLTFASLDPGTYLLTVTNAAPYADAAGSVTVTSDGTAQVTVTLETVAAPTTVATQPGNATPVTTVTVVPTQGSGGGVVIPTSPPTSGVGGLTPSNPNAPTGGMTVKALPNTGSGQGASSTSLVMLLLAVLAVGVAGAFAWRRRTR